MTLRHISPDTDPATVSSIDARLAQLAQQHEVTIRLAIESGSRAWGFPSPDSDYDCRFIFVRPLHQYLSPWQRRDVIETPLESVFDIDGWELGKALKLMLKGNAVVLEWLQSPIVYAGDAGFRDAFLDLARRHSNRTLIARHYLHLGMRQRKIYFGDGKTVALKKMFYALRPAAALRWLRLHPDAAIAPMHFPPLMAQCDPPAEVTDITADLLARKAITRELGVTLLPAAIGRFIDHEFALAEAVFEQPRAPSPSERAHQEIDTFFRDTVLS